MIPKKKLRNLALQKTLRWHLGANEHGN